MHGWYEGASASGRRQPILFRVVYPRLQRVRGGMGSERERPGNCCRPQPAPVGFVRRDNENIEENPDLRAQWAVGQAFATFRESIRPSLKTSCAMLTCEHP
jgi:hypothetical protein